MSSIEQIMTLVSKMSSAEKLTLNAQIAASMAGEKPKSSRKGKPASLGIRAWTAFVAHAQKTMPERFAAPALPKDRLIIAGAIRLENPAAYATFCEDFKKQNPVSTPSTDDEAASEAEPAAAEGGAAVAVKADKPKRVISDEQKAKMKAGREAAKAIKDAAIAAGVEPPKKAKSAKKAKDE